MRTVIASLRARGLVSFIALVIVSTNSAVVAEHYKVLRFGETNNPTTPFRLNICRYPGAALDGGAGIVYTNARPFRVTAVNLVLRWQLIDSEKAIADFEIQSLTQCVNIGELGIAFASIRTNLINGALVAILDRLVDPANPALQQDFLVRVEIPDAGWQPPGRNGLLISIVTRTALSSAWVKICEQGTPVAPESLDAYSGEDFGLQGDYLERLKVGGQTPGVYGTGDWKVVIEGYEPDLGSRLDPDGTVTLLIPEGTAGGQMEKSVDLNVWLPWGLPLGVDERERRVEVEPGTHGFFRLK